MRDRFVDRIKASLDPIHLIFGLLPVMTGLFAFDSWRSAIVKRIRGGEVKGDWRLGLATGAFLASLSIASQERAYGAVELQRAAVEMRRLLDEAAEDAKQRDQRAAEEQDRLATLTGRLVRLAAFTLAAAVVTLAVSIVG
jgi:hypothetical protein